MNPFFIPKMIADIAAGHISIKYGLRGPNYVTVSACASSTNAIIDAFNYIRLGKCDAIVTGGSEAGVSNAEWVVSMHLRRYQLEMILQKQLLVLLTKTEMAL